MLPDILRPDLQIVFCGTAVATASAERGHYYSGRGNKFWQLLHDACFTPVRLGPEQDVLLLQYGIGVTDLVKDKAQSHDRGLDFSAADRTASVLRSADPRWIAFNGITAGRVAATQLKLARRRDLRLGEQSWSIGESRVFVLPSSSGANATMSYQSKLEWWTRLRLVGTDSKEQPRAESV